MEFIKCKRYVDTAQVYKLTQTTPHPEGSDRGGSAVECYNFRVEGNKVTHEYSVDVDEPDCFGLTKISMKTKEQAIALIDQQRALFEKKLLEMDELKASLLESEYDNISWDNEDEDESDEDESDEDESDED